MQLANTHLSMQESPHTVPVSCYTRVHAHRHPGRSGRLCAGGGVAHWPPLQAESSVSPPRGLSRPFRPWSPWREG